jgi:hypothetical protein
MSWLTQSNNDRNGHSAAAHPPEFSPAEQGGVRAISVLVIEDDDETRALIRTALEGAGYTVETRDQWE